jgi:hypothetical protein
MPTTRLKVVRYDGMGLLRSFLGVGRLAGLEQRVGGRLLRRLDQGVHRQDAREQVGPRLGVDAAFQPVHGLELRLDLGGGGQEAADPVQDVLGLAEGVAGLADQVRPDVDRGADRLPQLVDLAGLLVDLGGEALELEAADLQPLGVGQQQYRHGGQHVDEVRDVGQAARLRGRRLGRRPRAAGDGHDLAAEVRARGQPVAEHPEGGEHDGQRERPSDQPGGLGEARAAPGGHDRDRGPRADAGVGPRSRIGRHLAYLGSRRTLRG